VQKRKKAFTGRGNSEGDEKPSTMCSMDTNRVLPILG